MGFFSNFPAHWIFMWSEEPEIKSKQASKWDRTLSWPYSMNSFKMHCAILLSSQTLLQLLANIHNFKLCRAFSDVMTHDKYNWVEFNLIHPLSLSTFKQIFQRSLLPEKKKKFFQLWIQLTKPNYCQDEIVCITRFD